MKIGKGAVLGLTRGGRVLRRLNATEFDGETEAELKARSVKCGWAVHVAKNMNQINSAKILALSHDGLHILEGNEISDRGPATELAWLDLVCLGREEGPATVECINGSKARGIIPRIIRLTGAHDLLENPDPDYEDFEFATDKEKVMWDWVSALKICGAVPTDYTDECYEKYLQANIQKFKKGDKAKERSQAKYDQLMAGLEAEANALSDGEAAYKASAYKEMEYQAVRDYDKGKLTEDKKCPCGTGMEFKACHMKQVDTIRQRMEAEEQGAAQEEARLAEEKSQFEGGLVDLYLADLLTLKEPCPCESGKSFKKCHYITLELNKVDKAQKMEERDSARTDKKEQRAGLQREKTLAAAPEKLRKAESKRLGTEKRADKKKFKKTVYDLFIKLDADESGELSKKEVKKGIAEIKLLVGMSDQKAKQIWKQADADHDNSINADEFYEFMKSAKPDFVPKMMSSVDSEAGSETSY